MRKNLDANPRKLQVIEVECILCYAKVVECEEIHANSMKGFKISQKLLIQLIE
jgi:hypothetical protein